MTAIGSLVDALAATVPDGPATAAPASAAPEPAALAFGRAGPAVSASGRPEPAAPASGPPGVASETASVGGLAARMVAAVRARTEAELELLGIVDAASPALAGIDAHFRTALWELLGPHVRDQRRIWQATRAAFGSGSADETFEQHLRDGGWAELLERLPRLATRLAGVVEDEIEATVRLLSRAARDADALAGRFGAAREEDALAGRFGAAREGDALAGRFGRSPGPLTDLRLGLSDPHNGRQTVAALTFASGLRVICKPRSVGLEAGLASTLAWLREHGGLDLPAAPKVLERDGYGWCAFVAPRACADRDEVELHFRRLGALAVVLAALAATDCHAENFVARGPDPVLLDAETLLHPRMLASPGFTLRETEIVPGQVRGPAGQLIDYSGFDGAAESEPVASAARSPVAGTPSTAPPAVGSSPNRSSPTAAVEPRAAALANLPRCDGVACLLRDHRAAFDAGAEAARTVLRAVGDELTAPAGQAEAVFARRPARVVLRPTSVYGALMAHLGSASALGSADGGFERVAGELARYRDPLLSEAAWEAVQRAELAALARADVPYFVADTTTGDLSTADGTVLAPGAVEPVLLRLGAVIGAVALS